MKVLFSTALFYPAKLGGPANTLYWLAKTLVKAGVQVTVVATNSQIDNDKVTPDVWTDVDGIRIKYCNSGSLCLIKELSNTWREMQGCDVVMLCDMFQRQVLSVAIMARLRKKRIIWSPRGELHAPAIAESKIKRWYISLVRRWFDGYVTFHATSEEERKLILKQIGDNAKVVEIPNYMELPLKQERVLQDIPYFLFVGRVNRIKALDRLILGLAKSESFKQSKYILKIAGPNQDDYQRELEQLIEESDIKGKVEFVGNVFGTEKFHLYANAHFSCLLSHSENFGNVVIEALSQGTPVVASTGTPWKVLNEKKAGFWIDNSPESITECIDKILKLSGSDYTDMRNNALELAKTFDVSQNIDKWTEVLNNC